MNRTRLTTTQHQVVEVKIHSYLYNNIHILTLIYPTTNDFNDIFKKDMFMKVNAKAFQYVVYYLLQILDPIEVKKKFTQELPILPCFANQFRKELIKYIKEINEKYEDASIPNLMESHLIAPKGYSFLMFMFKLSKFVLQQHLNRNSNKQYVIKRLKSNKKSQAVTKMNIDNLKTVTGEINENTKARVEDFQKLCNVSRDEAEEIIKQSSEFDKQVSELQQTLNSFKEEVKSISGPSEACLNEIKNKMPLINNILLKCDKMKENLNNLLNSKKLVLEYNKENYQENTGSMLFEDNELDLLNLLQKLKQFLCHLPRLTFNLNQNYINEQLESVTRFSNSLSLYNETLKSVYDSYTKLLNFLTKKPEFDD